MEARERPAASTQYLGFYVAGEECGIDIFKITEIVEYPVVTRVPTMPPFVRGVMNLRGSVVPVIDLAVKFGLPEAPVTKRTCIVLVEADLEGAGTLMGVVADSVSQVIELSPTDVLPPPSFGTTVWVDYLLGLGKVGEGFVLLLDIDHVLSAAELLKMASLDREAPAEAGPAEPSGGAGPGGVGSGAEAGSTAEPPGSPE